jgi:hypothetical protein
MKSKILRDAEGNEVNVTELESFSSVHDLMADPEEFIRRANKEEEDDKRLDDLTQEIIPLFDKARYDDRAINYWQIGGAINSFRKNLPGRDARESWFMKSNILERLAQKMDRKGLSRRHLEEMIYFNEHWKLEEIDEKIPWSFYAELAIKANKIPKRTMRTLQQLISSGKIKDHKKLRDKIEALTSDTEL